MSSLLGVYERSPCAKKIPNYFGPTQWSHDKNGVKMHKTWWKVTIDLDIDNVMLIWDSRTGVTYLLNFENGSTIQDKDAIFSHRALTWTKWTGPSKIAKAGDTILVTTNGNESQYTQQKVKNLSGADWCQLGDPFCKYIKNKKYYITPLVYNYVIGHHVWYWEYEPWVQLSLAPTFTIGTWHSPVLCLPIY